MARLKQGINDLATKSPNIALEWDYDKNFPLKPSEICNSSRAEVWWKCNHGHSWKASVDTRTSRAHSRCPICTNQLVIPGLNDFATVCPELLGSWCYEKNEVQPQKISSGYAKSVWWVCENNHSWRTSIANRKKQNECPFCNGRKILPGYNDLHTKRPELILEWDYERNTIAPESLGVGSPKKVWWRCTNGHSWDAAVSSRVKGVGCPICSNQRVLVGYNDFPTTYPQLLQEWDYSKNVGINPYDYTAGSERYAWWKCSKGHSWKTMICSRTQGYGCPICAKEYKTSIPEQAVFYYCKYVDQLAVNGYQPEWLGKSEIDIFLPSLMIGIEYDGRAWHKNIEKDQAKDDICLKNGIRIFRIREPGISCYSDDCVGLTSLSQDSLSEGIMCLFRKMGITGISVDVSRDIDVIYRLMEFREKQFSLAAQYPAIAHEWDYERNGEYITPEAINGKSGKSVYWICPKGHSYEMRVDHRTISNAGCPYCSGKKVLKGFNDLITTSSELAEEWNYQKNIDISPEEVTKGSNKKVWWLCRTCGNEWQAAIGSRSRGSGCPRCARIKRTKQKRS